MSTKPIHLCSILNFGSLDNHGKPGGVSIVFLYKPGTDNLNFRLCAIAISYKQNYGKKYSENISLCIRLDCNYRFAVTGGRRVRGGAAESQYLRVLYCITTGRWRCNQLRTKSGSPCFLRKPKVLRNYNDKYYHLTNALT